jgi:hypothetical protein
MVNAVNTFSAMGDDQRLELFTAVALMNENPRSDGRELETRLMHKQFYSRMTRLMKAGLIRRHKGKYLLTSYGIVVYSAQTTIERAARDWWKLKTIDSLEMEMNGNLNLLPGEGRNKIIETVIDDPEIKDILIRYYNARTAAAGADDEGKVYNKK